MRVFKRTLSRMSPLLRPETPVYLAGLFAAAVICFLVLVVLWSTFQVGLPNPKNLITRFSLENYIEVFSYPLMPTAALNTVLLALGTTAVSLFFAVPMAWLIHRTTMRFKQFFITLMLLHVVLPSFIRVMGWIMLISPDVGIFNQAIRAVMPIFDTGPMSPYNLPFMMFLQGITFTPTLFLMLGGAFMAIDPSFEEAAEASGMSRVQILRRISFPLVKSAIVAGSIYVFVTAASMFEVPALLGAPFNIHVFSTLMYDFLFPDMGLPSYGIAGVYGIIMVVPTLVALYYYQRMMKLSHRYATVTGKGYRPKLTDLGSWSWAGLAFIIFYYTIDLVLPYLAVVWTSLLPYIQMPSMAALKTLSLEGYREGIATMLSLGAIGNTLQLIFSVGLLSMLVGLIMSWIILRTRMPGRFTIDTIAMLPQVVPTIAFAFAVAFVGIILIRVLPLHGSIAAIILADTVRRIPFTTRTINSSLIQIHPELEEAVQTSGASKVVALRKVIIPLIAPALLYSFIWSLLHAYREVTTALFLLSPRNMVLATVIWTQWTGSGTMNVAAAISVIMVTIMAILILILMKVFPQITGRMKL